MNRKIDTGALAAGLALLAVGIVMFVARFTDLEFGDLVQRYWPIIFFVIGVPKLFRRETVWNGLWTVALGTWLQLVQLRAFGLTYRNSWPLLLIVLGAGMIVRAMLEVALPREENHEQR